MSVLTLNVDEAMRTLSAESANPFVVHDKEVDIVRFAINSGFADIVLDGQVALRVMYQRPGETEVRAQTLTYYDTDGLRNYYDWQLLSADLEHKGTITCALCILRTDSEVEEWHTTPYQIRVLGSIHTDDSDEGDETITPTVAQRVAILESVIQSIAGGAPTVVSSVSAMTDTEQIYVLTTDGKWYYYNLTSSAWVEGGVYGGVPTDTTLTQSGMAADAEVVGNAIDDVNSKINTNQSGLFDLYANENFDFSDVTRSSYCINSLGKWTNGSTQKSYAIEIPSDTKAVIVTSVASGSVVAWLKSYSPATGAYADFAPSYPSRIEMDEGDSLRFIIEDNMIYLYVLLKTSSGVDKTPSVYLCYEKTDKTLQQAHVAADAKAVGDKFNSFLVLHKEEATYTDINKSKYSIPSTGIWANTSSGYIRSYTFPLTGVKKVRITGGENGSIVAFLNTYAPTTGAAVDFATEYSDRIVLVAGDAVEYEITGEMHYLYALLTDSTQTDKTPMVEVYRYAGNNELYSVDVESDSETDKHDMAAEINALLHTAGYCKLSRGVFYIGSSIYMPYGSMLIGSGADTVLKLLDNAESGSAIIMGSSCTVKDMTVKGATSAKSSVNDGTRHGIEWTGEEKTAGVIDNCVIKNFDASGIYLHDTTQKTYRNLSIANCYITGCHIGIYIRNDSEFNKIVGCTIVANGIGYLNRGGNNNMSNCGIDANTIGIQIDMNEGDNNGHGTISNCSINHSNHNNGYGLIIKDTGRMLVSNCNIYYSKLKLDTTNGNVIANCGFGASAQWEINGGECSLFIGCMVRGWDASNSPVSIVNNDAVKIVNCFDRNGNPYSA